MTEGFVRYTERMRIASLSPAVTEILFSLGLEDQIVCTDQFSNFPEEARDIPHVRNHMEINPEELRTFDPEIVFTSTIIQEKLATELEQQGLSVVHQDIRTLQQIYTSIHSIGTIFELEKESQELTLSMQQGFNDVKKKAALLPRRPRLYIEEWHQPPMASGNWVPEVARFAGCDQFPIPTGELSREVTLEEVQKFDPDMVVISWCGAGMLADPAILEKREGWKSLRALQEGNIRVIDDSLLNRPGPRLVEGARHLYGWSFELLH